MVKRVIAIIIIYVVVAVAWFVLGGVTSVRSGEFDNILRQQVAGLWGDPQVQRAPELELGWWEIEIEKKKIKDEESGETKLVEEEKPVWRTQTVLLDSTDVDVAFDLAHRRKGLLWYATYTVDFAAEYSYVHRDEKLRTLFITYRFPTTNASYDNFVFQVDGHSDESVTPTSDGQGKVVRQKIAVTPGQTVPFKIAYQSRGLNSWRYNFGANVNRVKNFTLTMNTNFDAIDFPDGSMSPTTKTKTDDGWNLVWQSSNLISGYDIAMDMPRKLNPGPLAAKISYFAPVSLLFFFVWLFVITLLKKVDLHPMNYLFLAAAFFAFHLLFAYTVDHLPLLVAFCLSSAVSVFLAISYLRLVVGLRFAAVEAGLAQVIYLVLFSYAHFYQGYTGLMVTIGSIMTLFIIMQLTGRIDWSDKFASSKPKRTPGPAAPVPAAQRLP